MSVRAAAAAVGATLAFAVPAFAQRLDAVFPAGGQRGTSVTVTCYGRDLGDAVGLVFPDPRGVVVESLEPVEGKNGTQLRAHLVVDPAAPLGSRAFAVHTKRGASRFKTFHVGALPELIEQQKRENGTAADANTIALDHTINGRISPATDVDCYAVELAEGQELVAEVEAVRLGQNRIDAWLELLDAEGRRLLAVDDTTYGRMDPWFRWTAPAAGRYVLAIRDANWRASGAAFYRLHVGTFPRPTGVFPAGVRPGETATVRWLGADEHEQSVAVPADQRGDFWAFTPECDGRFAPTPLRLRLADVRHVVELDDRGEQSKRVEKLPFALHGVLAKPGEYDRVRVALKKGQTLTVLAVARRLRSPVDPVLAVRDLRGRGLRFNDDSGHPDSVLTYRVPADGEYLVDVRDVLRRGGPDFVYRLELGTTGIGMRTRVAIPGVRGEDVSVVVPRGGRVATVLAATGGGVGDDTRPTFGELPAGVTAQSSGFGSLGSVVVFSAVADSPLEHSAARVALARDGEEPRDANFLHGLPMVRIENDQLYEQRALARLPVVVTEASPFAIDIDAPTVPIVRGGPLRLRIRVTRAEGFGGAVRARLLVTPTGVGAGEVTVPAGKDEAVMQLNARSNAPLRTWTLAVVGRATVGGVTRNTSSAPFELEVASPWIEAKIGRARAEQGQATQLTIEFDRKKEFVGDAKVELLRLPRGVAAAELPALAADAVAPTDVALTYAKDAQPGRHRRQYVRITVPVADRGDVVHVFGGGEIRVDRPLPAHLREKLKRRGKAGAAAGGSR